MGGNQKNGFLIHIVPLSGVGKVRKFLVTNFLVKLVISVVISFVFTTIFLLVYFFNTEVDKNKLNFLIRENSFLTKKISSLMLKNDSLVKKIEKLANEINKLRKHAGLDAIDEDFLKMGIGGSLVPSQGLASLEKRIDYMLKLVHKFDRKLSEYKDVIDKKKNELEHTPSILPVASGFIVSGFGYRKDPFTGRIKLHEGVDVSSGFGAPVISTAKGKVTYSGWREGYGLTVEIDHGNGFKTIYAHNSKNLVQVGESVERGEIIALMGSTGKATGVHVHYEVRLFNKPLNPINFIIPDHLYFD
ncbi:MAG: peptidoglycan DD-metalloendopeptidase family protein [Candidatus Hydrothermales bacterium]